MKRRWAVRIFVLLVFILFVLPLLIPLNPTGVDAAVLADEDGRFITVNGLQTYLVEQGNVENPPLLLLHGWGGSSFSWRDTLPALAEAGYHAIAFDRPPYGLSQKTGELPLSQSEQAAFTAAFMDAMNLEAATLVGHSMGGGVIGYFAAAYEERVQALVFVDGAPRIAAANTELPAARGSFGVPSWALGLLDFPSFERWARIAVRTFIRPDAFTELQRSAYYDPADVTPEVAAGYGRQLQVVGWDEALLQIVRGTSASDTPLTPEQAEAITAPTLIVWGENDTWVPLTSGAALAGYLPNERLITYAETGHLPMEEQPELFNRDLIAFLEDVYDE